MRDYEEKSYYEIQLDNKQLILVFLAGITVCVLIFVLGVMVGKGKKEAEMASLQKPEQKSAKVEPEPESDTNVPEETKTVHENPKSDKGKNDTKPAPSEDSKYAFTQLDKPESKDDKLTPEPSAKPSSNRTDTTQKVVKAAPPAAAPAPKTTSPPAPATVDSAPAVDSAPTEPSQGSSKHYTVQVMATASQQKATQELNLLKSKGYTAFMDQEKAGNGSVFKVRVGKFADSETAKKTATKLKQDLKLDTWVAVLE
ncbi:MAG: hypothetical protein C5B54_01960 [Acidobacteria bacterium]|nr:MAG: hypothetical protein C5B54_01960 [Acidobacteriota bacterium]